MQHIDKFAEKSSNIFKLKEKSAKLSSTDDDFSIQNESKKMTRDALDFTERIIDKFPARLSGSDDCKNAAKFLNEEFAKTCDSVCIEEFEHRPEAMLGFMKVLSITYILATFLLFLNTQWSVLTAIGLFSFGIIFSVCQFVLYLETFDFMFRKKKGYNIIGTIEPKNNPPKQQIIIGGHHDAAHVLNFFYKTQKWYSQRIFIGLGFFGIMTIFALIRGISWIITGNTPFGFNAILLIGIIGLVFNIPFFWFVSPKISPGAGDNMIATSIALEIAKKFHFEKQNDRSLINNTRLIFISFDAEEAGLRGSRAYVKRHKKELTEIPTYVFNLDSLYNVDEMHLTISEINDVVKNSEQLADEIVEIGEDLGYEIDTFPMVFGGGATDAASFSQIGVEATTLVAMSVEMHGREGLVYHTPNDTVDYIEPECVEACINLIYNFIIEKEKSTKKI